MAYREDRSFEKIVAGALGLVVVLFAIGWVTRNDPAEKPYVVIAGGGFIYNYRVAEVFYGFTAMIAKPVASGSILVAEFENPAGGEPLVVEERVTARTDRYGIRSPRVSGVKAGEDYEVKVSLYDRTRSELIWSDELSYAAARDDTIVPDQPLTVGPGYDQFPGPAAECTSPDCGRTG